MMLLEEEANKERAEEALVSFCSAEFFLVPWSERPSAGGSSHPRK